MAQEGAEMGLERHVNRVLEERAPHLNPVPGRSYGWEYGALFAHEDDAEEIMEALDASGEFGPTRFVPDQAGVSLFGVIEFGLYVDYFEGSIGRCCFENYEDYCDQFRKGMAH
jgi:hypothetical protein